MTDTTTVVARYLALGGAHVTITKVVDAWPGGYGPSHPADGPVRVAFEGTCEACGHLRGEYAHEQRSSLGYRVSEAEAAAQDAVELAAITHAESCRRIPERLWPEGGA